MSKFIDDLKDIIKKVTNGRWPTSRVTLQFHNKSLRIEITISMYKVIKIMVWNNNEVLYNDRHENGIIDKFWNSLEDWLNQEGGNYGDND